MKINNNVSFNGFGLQYPVRSENLPKLHDFVSKNRELITDIDVFYKTDVFLTSDCENVLFDHHELRGIMPRGNMKRIPVSKFTENRRWKIFKELDKAIDKTAQEADRWELYDKIF